MNDNVNLGTHVGTSSILLILMVLSLISFSTLSIANASADKRLTDTLATRTQDYYAVSHEASAWVASMDHEGTSATFNSFALTENQSLEVSIVPVPGKKASGNIAITRWQVVTDDDIEYDNTLPVIK
ncbi:MAG: hypothetical protein K5900_01070 [Butyrivibrio sp.]|nr:hypothetical protein [Butyrivibrio sp.]